MDGKWNEYKMILSICYYLIKKKQNQKHTIPPPKKPTSKTHTKMPQQDPCTESNTNTWIIFRKHGGKGVEGISRSSSSILTGTVPQDHLMTFLEAFQYIIFRPEPWFQDWMICVGNVLRLQGLSPCGQPGWCSKLCLCPWIVMSVIATAESTASSGLWFPSPHGSCLFFNFWRKRHSRCWALSHMWIAPHVLS